ncbi:CLUMA_CG014761, isoform A [Clunio marinus]|uniref:CLUMA_CG014761, isoform A n=1 Tax=Clunio marinus TaxID=568069 RepID=A0A1J1IMF1_9DIPT|nr:CLUMA_CG014761, isoform A [Clunio marinus]
MVTCTAETSTNTMRTGMSIKKFSKQAALEFVNVKRQRDVSLVFANEFLMHAFTHSEWQQLLVVITSEETKEYMDRMKFRDEFSTH